MEQLREKARHSEAQAPYHAMNEERLGIAKNILQMNMPVEDVIKLIGDELRRK